MILTDDNTKEYKKCYGIPDNFHWFREHYPFGYAPSFRSSDTPIEEYLYVYTTYNKEGKGNTRVYTWQELRELLRDTWRPQASNDRNWYAQHVA